MILQRKGGAPGQTLRSSSRQVSHDEPSYSPGSRTARDPGHPAKRLGRGTEYVTHFRVALLLLRAAWPRTAFDCWSRIPVILSFCPPTSNSLGFAKPKTKNVQIGRASCRERV